MSTDSPEGQSLSIGEVAARTGVASSAIRYWEEEGLLEPAPRRGGRRIYDAAVLDRVALIRLAQRAGFRIPEIRALLRGFPPRASAGERWRSLVERKQADVREHVAELARMLAILETLASCDCPDLDACGAAARRAAGNGMEGETSAVGASPGARRSGRSTPEA